METIEKYGKHQSVLLDECVSYILENKEKDKIEWIADLTFGAGGHSIAFCELNDDVNLLSFDQDMDAINNGNKKIVDKNYQDRVKLIHSNYEKIDEIVKSSHTYILDEGGFLGILMDLGVSSHQFDNGDRGFSFMHDGPLDMRMNQTNDENVSAKEVVNSYNEADIADIIYKYGEEGFSRVIARNIVAAREKKEIETTKELEDIVFHSYPAKMRKGKTHPATRTFQGLRLYVNRELEVLENTLLKAANLLKPCGRLAVISFHSLEDRIVKHEFRRFQREVGGFKVLTKKPIIPKSDEIKRNFRSRSAKLRVLERI